MAVCALKALTLLWLLCTPTYQQYSAPVGLSTSKTMPVIQSVIKDNLLFLKDQGVFVEPSGFAYTYSTFVYESIHVVIPELLDIDYHLPHCTENENHMTAAEKKVMIENVLGALKTRIPEYKSPFMTTNSTKSKRELITLALLTATGLVSLGISLYSTVQVKSVAKQAEKITTEINRISESQAKTTYAIRQLTDGFNNLTTVIVPAIEKQIQVLSNEISCTAMRGQYFTELNRRLTQDLFVTVTSGANAMYNGKVTPDFFPPSEIRSKLLSRDDMIGSIYNTDPTLVYQLGRFMLMSVGHKPFSISGMLILPRLLKEYVGIVLSINKVPLHYQGYDSPVILDGPDLAVKEMSSKKLWTPNFDICIKHTGTYYCPLHEIRAKYSHCLTDMMFNSNATTCKYIEATGYPLVRQTAAGVLIASSITDYVSIRIDADGNRQSEKRQMPSIGTTNFLTLHHGTEIMIDHNIYLLSHDTAEIVLQINDTITFPDSDIDLPVVPSLDPVRPVDQYVPHYLTMEWSYGEVAVMACVLLSLAYLYIQNLIMKRDLCNLTLYTQGMSRKSSPHLLQIED